MKRSSDTHEDAFDAFTDNMRIVRNFYAALISQAIADSIDRSLSKKQRDEARCFVIENCIGISRLIDELGGPCIPAKQIVQIVSEQNDTPGAACVMETLRRS